MFGFTCRSAAKAKIQAVGLEELETIPHQGGTTLSVESFAAIAQYLRKVRMPFS